MGHQAVEHRTRVVTDDSAGDLVVQPLGNRQPEDPFGGRQRAERREHLVAHPPVDVLSNDLVDRVRPGARLVCQGVADRPQDRRPPARLAMKVGQPLRRELEPEGPEERVRLVWREQEVPHVDHGGLDPLAAARVAEPAVGTRAHHETQVRALPQQLGNVAVCLGVVDPFVGLDDDDEGCRPPVDRVADRATRSDQVGARGDDSRDTECLTDLLPEPRSGVDVLVQRHPGRVDLLRETCEPLCDQGALAHPYRSANHGERDRGVELLEQSLPSGQRPGQSRHGIPVRPRSGRSNLARADRVHAHPRPRESPWAPSAGDPPQLTMS